MGHSGPDSGSATVGFQWQRAASSPICLHRWRRRRDKSTCKAEVVEQACAPGRKATGGKTVNIKTVQAANQVTA